MDRHLDPETCLRLVDERGDLLTAMAIENVPVVGKPPDRKGERGCADDDPAE
jgi:hypothetical protein